MMKTRQEELQDLIKQNISVFADLYNAITSPCNPTTINDLMSNIEERIKYEIELHDLTKKQ